MKTLLLTLCVTISALTMQSLALETSSAALVSEIIPIKYALASEIALVINSLKTNSASAPSAASGPGAISSFSQRLQRAISQEAASGGALELKEAKIIADERTNSLLISATPEGMQKLKAVISKLDVVLPQILIEAAVIEVSWTNSIHSRRTNLNEGTEGTPDFSRVAGVSNISLLCVTNFVPPLATNAAGRQPTEFGYAAMLDNTLDALLTTFASDSRARILQRPRIQTSDGVTATLFVGESRPSDGYYSGGATCGYASIQQISLGVTLDVTPYIKPDGFLLLDIHQTVEKAAGSVNIENVGDVPITSRKESQIKLPVRDRGTILIGGLNKTIKNQGSSGVPFLKDIPVFGVPFRGSSARTTRSEFIVLIRPTVLPDPERELSPPRPRAGF